MPMIRTITAFEAVSADDAERAEFVVCPLSAASTPFREKIEAHCGDCAKGIIHRPGIPTKPPTICVSCWFDRVTGGDRA